MPARSCHRLNRVDIAPGDSPYLWKTSRQIEGESIVETREPWMEGCLQGRRVGAGRIMHWGAERTNAEIVYHGRPAEKERGIYFIFALHGGWRDTFRSKSRTACERSAGQMSVLRVGDLNRHHLMPSPDAWHLCINVEPVAMAEWVGEGQDNGDGIRLIRSLHQGEGPPHLTLPMTPSVRLALEKVRDCPHCGVLRNLAMEARCNDLLISFVEALEGTPPREIRFEKNQVDRIHAAAAALAARLEEPPSVSELARSVGLNESYLTRGFRQVFGTTPFGWLRERRMERARELLESGRMSVLEAALFVGHRNPGHFACLFARQFGVAPGEVKRRAGRG